jgi:hypothetical protein
MVSGSWAMTNEERLARKKERIFKKYNPETHEYS